MLENFGGNMKFKDTYGVLKLGANPNQKKISPFASLEKINAIKRKLFSNNLIFFAFNQDNDPYDQLYKILWEKKFHSLPPITE